MGSSPIIEKLPPTVVSTGRRSFEVISQSIFDPFLS